MATNSGKMHVAGDEGWLPRAKFARVSCRVFEDEKNRYERKGGVDTPPLQHKSASLLTPREDQTPVADFRHDVVTFLEAAL